jgi:hypothetical protein
VILTSREVDAAEALRLHLVTEVTDPGGLTERGPGHSGRDKFPRHAIRSPPVESKSYRLTPQPKRAAPVFKHRNGPGIDTLTKRGATMTTIISDRDRWHIPPAPEAATVPAAGGYPARLARIAALDADRMAESLVFLSGYAPGVLDAILTATEPCLDDLFPPDEDALEPYCTQCGGRAGVFIARGQDWLHYAGDPAAGTAEPFDAGHAPVIGWRPAQDGPAIVAL